MPTTESDTNALIPIISIPEYADMDTRTRIILVLVKHMLLLDINRNRFSDELKKRELKIFSNTVLFLIEKYIDSNNCLIYIPKNVVPRVSKAVLLHHSHQRI